MEPIKKLVKQAITQIERERDHFATSLNITGTQMSVIDYLSNMPNYTASQNEIEQEFDIRRSTTTIMVPIFDLGTCSKMMLNISGKAIPVAIP